MAAKGDVVGSDTISRHWTIKEGNMLRGKYARIWALSRSAVHHIDPDSFKITNSWPWSDVVEFVPSAASRSDFTFTVRTGKKSEVLKFICDSRSDLLCNLQRYSAGNIGARRFTAVKITRASLRQEVTLELLTWCINVYTPDNSKQSTYLFSEITAIKPVRDDPAAVVIYAHGRGRLYATPERSEFMRLIMTNLTKLGMAHLIVEGGVNAAEYRAERLAHGNEPVPRIVEFDVLKTGGRSVAPRPRKLIITETALTERDAATYGVVSSRPLTSVLNLVRHWDEPQTLTVEYRDGSSRTYLTSLRDSFLGSLLDACHNSDNMHVAVSARPTAAGERTLPLSVSEDPTIEAAYLANLTRNLRSSGGGSAGPFNQALVQAAAEFNENVSAFGLKYSVKKSSVSSVIGELVITLANLLAIEDVPTEYLTSVLFCLQRLVAASAGYKLLSTLPDTNGVLIACLRHPEDGVSYAAFELFRRLMHNPRRPADQDEDVEAAVKRALLTQDVRVALIHALDTHAVIGAGGAGNEGTLTVMSIAQVLDSILVGHADTTPPEAADHLMQLVASRYSSLLSLFRCKSSGVVESCAMLMRAIVDMADLGICRAMQLAALSSGVWLRHFYQAIFAPSQDARHQSRYLIELWSTGSPTAREVLRHMLPSGFLAFLDHPKLSNEERDHMLAVEASKQGAQSGAGNKGGLSRRLRDRLENAERVSTKKVRRRLTALDENAAGAKRGFRRGKVDPLKAANVAAQAMAAVKAQREITKAKMEEGREENYSMLFFELQRDHMLPDLIWNQQTRQELRGALEAELREIEKEIELGGQINQTKMEGDFAQKKAEREAQREQALREAQLLREQQNAALEAKVHDKVHSNLSNVVLGTVADPDLKGIAETATAGLAKGTATLASVAERVASKLTGPSVDDFMPELDTSGPTISGEINLRLNVAWNFSEFEVHYPSLAQETKVGDYYIRILLEAGDAALSAVRQPGRFFDALYRRVLREQNPALKCVCIRAMTRIYQVHHETVGFFDDTDYVVYLLSTTMHAEVRDRLLILLQTLTLCPLNSELMITPECLELLVDLLTTAHTHDNEQRALPSLKAASGLLLTDATPAQHAQYHDPTSPHNPVQANINPKESLKIWHYRAKKAHLQEGERPDKGPYSLQDMQRLGDMKLLHPDSLVWAQGMRDWVRLDSMRALLWYTLSEGTAALEPVQRGEVACSVLRTLVALRPAVDAEGAPVRPVPKAKRVLCGSRTLPHIAQALLVGSAQLVDTVTELLTELLLHNPRAMVKLYTTGVFYFLMSYNGSNWTNAAQFLRITHLQQSFHTDAASLNAERTLVSRSILGDMLPASLIAVLENRGAGAFAEALMANVDNPEVIWKYSMRAHLLEMVQQHLGDLPLRLAANPCTLYDWCPIPPIKYEELEREHFCADYYLNNLCDEAKFPDWEIRNPVALLRAVLDAWRKEVLKTGEKTVSTDDALKTLELQPGASDVDVRKAYRKLAMKYHPDKNPDGREIFERIQKAYDTVTKARPDASASGSAAGGADPIVVLLLIRTQGILFARHKAVLKEYKYAGYPLLMDAIQGSRAADTLAGDRLAHLDACTRLVYLTCLASPKNAEELVREKGVEVLMGVLARMAPHCVRGNNGGAFPAGSVEVSILANTLHTLSGLATLKDARAKMAADPNFCSLVVLCLSMVGAARILQYALECMARLAVVDQLQEQLVRAGAVYRLLPLVFRFDASLEEEGATQQQSHFKPAANASNSGNAVSGAAATAAPPANANQWNFQGSAPVAPTNGISSTTLALFSSAGQYGSGGGSSGGPAPTHAVHTDNEQRAANTHAKLAVRALARLGGYLEGDLASPVNSTVRRSLSSLLTPPLARQLSKPLSAPLLKILNSHEESAAILWTAPMRTELLQFLSVANDHLQRTGVADMNPARSFQFTALREELRINQVYLRFYVQDPAVKLEDPQGTLVACMQHVCFSRAGANSALNPLPEAWITQQEAKADDFGPAYPFLETNPELARKHLRLALRALHLLIVSSAQSERTIESCAHELLPPIVRLLDDSSFMAGASNQGEDDGAYVHASGPVHSRAGSAVSAGAGGARSTPAPPTATMKELLLCVLAAMAPSEPVGALFASLHLVPVLIRQLARDSGAFGPILRTLFAHAPVIAEIARIGAIIDLVYIFAGGAVTGPLPRQQAPGVPQQAVQSSIPKPARSVAAELLSMMASDAQNGPSLLMNLTQLMPEALAIAVKESSTGANTAGTGSTSMLSAGSGLGAAGAGGGAGSIGDIVSILDTDHEVPELIWNSICRHELRAALGELQNGINGLRKRAASANGAALPHPNGYGPLFDGCGWQMPPTFRVRYSSAEGELRVGSVYIRLFLKEPTYPLRDPKAFLEALMRRFLTEAEQLCGMTSDDADRVRAAQQQAAENARREAEAGGLALKKPGSDTPEGGALVVRGEDVLTQLTHGIVCLLRVRQALADQAAALGYVHKLVALVDASVGKVARYNIAVQSLRVCQVLTASKQCVVAFGKANTVGIFSKLLRVRPLPRDLGFFLEALKQLLEADSQDFHILVEQAIRADLIPLFVGILERENLENLVDPSAAKVHSVAIIKILENDALHGPSAQAVLAGQHGAAWDKYKHQKHDLFLSKNDTRDYFLTDLPTANPTLMLKQTEEWGRSTQSNSNQSAYGVASGAGAGTESSFPLPSYPLPDTSAPPPPSLAPPPQPVVQNTFGFGSTPAAPAPSNPFGFGVPTPAPAPSMPGGNPFGFGAPAPAPAPSANDPFAGLLGSSAPVAPRPAAVPANYDPFAM